jgi:hypothetical protein
MSCKSFILFSEIFQKDLCSNSYILAREINFCLILVFLNYLNSKQVYSDLTLYNALNYHKINTIHFFLDFDSIIYPGFSYELF